MVMEYLSGGDLYSLLKNLQLFDENMTRAYIAGMLAIAIVGMTYCYCYAIAI